MTEFSQTDEQFQLEFRAFEPDFDFLASFGDNILPALEELLAGDDELIAQRAVYVAGLLEGGAGLALLEDAVQDPRATVRVAVAGAVRSRSIAKDLEANRPPIASGLSRIISRLLSDEDSSVRRWAAKSAGSLRLNSVQVNLEKIASDDSEQFVRAAAIEALKNVAE